MSQRFVRNLGRQALGALVIVWMLVSCGGGSGDSRGPLPPPGGGGAAVVITAPADLSTVSTANLVVSATATAAAGTSVATIEFQIDGVTIGTPSAATDSAPVTVADFASGQHVIRARAIDNSGGTSGWTTVTVQFPGTRTQPAGFSRDEAFVTGLSSATAIAQAPDGRLFIAEQGGALRVVTAAGALQATPFATLTVDSQGERGLLGVTLHPDFATNHFVYVYYTATTPTVHNRIGRFVANGDVAAGAVQVLFDLPSLSATNHNGGAIHFGADGKLYVGVGENANRANAQSTTTVLGKMLRLNDDGTIPPDNPFFNQRTGDARAVWADGLRNPFTFAIQPGAGRMYINDVGEGDWEEIDVGVAGANYGWPNSEGPTSAAGETGPLFTYKHAPGNPPGSEPGGFFTGAAIAGGAFYPTIGPFSAPYLGGYFFADYIGRFVGFLDLANDNAAYAFGGVTARPVDMLVADDGALLVLTRNNVVRFNKP
jgi:glucose/arabinose dehydrogenase